MIGLSDLDELLLTVRDKTSKVYVNEAVLSYRNGAYRAAIVSNWIAVTFDIIAKIRELAEQNDNKAQSDIKDMGNYISNKQIAKLQEFENSLLVKAEKEYKFITSTELKDLERLKEDRNLCAHPAISENGLLYQPTAELVKTHIVHSIVYLLQHQPVQGKAALDKIFDDIKKSSFPTNYDQTKIWLDTKYFNKAKPALMQNLIHALLKGLLNGDIAKHGKTLQVLNTLQVIAANNPQLYYQEQNQVLKKVVENLLDEQLWNLLELLTVDKSIWAKLSGATQIRLKVFLETESTTNNILNKYAIALQLDISDLRTTIEKVIEKVSDEIEKKIEIYANVPTYIKAREVGENIILPCINCFNVSNTKNIISAIMNDTHQQILWASGSEQIIEAIYDSTVIHVNQTLDDWQQLLDKLDKIRMSSDYMRLRNKINTAYAIKYKSK